MVRSVSPIYYVTFTTVVLTASFVLFQGFNVTDTIETVSLLSGFLIIFSGVYLLNYPSNDADGYKSSIERLANGAVTDGAGDVRISLVSQDSSRSSEETQCEDRTGLIKP